MPRTKAETTENLTEEVNKKAKQPKRYKISQACYVDNRYHAKGDIIILSDPSLLADYMEEV